MEDKDIYAKLKEFLTPEITKRIDEVYGVDTRFAIIMTIDRFGSGNIKKIARILGKNNATIHHHLKWLTDEKFGPPMLEIDTKETQSKRGIYYTLSDIAKRVFGEPPKEVGDKMIDKFDEFLEQSDEVLYKLLIQMIMESPNVESMRKEEEQILAYNHFMEQFMINNLEHAYTSMKEGKKPVNKNYPFGSLSNYDMNIKVSKARHMFEVMKMLTEFSVKFSQLGEKFKDEMDEEKIPEDERIPMRYHIYGGEVAEFEFE